MSKVDMATIVVFHSKGQSLTVLPFSYCDTFIHVIFLFFLEDVKDACSSNYLSSPPLIYNEGYMCSIIGLK